MVYRTLCTVTGRSSSLVDVATLAWRHQRSRTRRGVEGRRVYNDSINNPNDINGDGELDDDMIWNRGRPGK